MPPVGFEPTISEGERPQTYALDRAATETATSRFNIQKFYMMFAVRWVFCTALKTDSGLWFLRHLVFMTVVESVYSAVRADSLYKADYVSSLKGFNVFI